VISPARRAAYAALRGTFEEGLDLPAALVRERDPLRDPRDRALVGQIVLGVLRWRGALDYMIERLVKRPLAKLDPEVIDILRIGVYQLWRLERVPAPAIVNDAVALTRVANRGRASSLVNATLRAFARTGAGDLLPAPQENATYLSIALSHPRWLVERWLVRYGFESATRWLQFNNAPAPLTLRVNTARTDAATLRDALAEERVATDRGRYAPDALVVSAGHPLDSPRFQAGEFIVQDEAAQLIAHFAGARPGDRVLDACASPGGKTLVISNGMRAGLVVAADVRPRRIALLAETLRRTGTPAAIVQLDLREPLPFGPVFDCVIVDAPCSGLGTLRRDPDIKWRRAEADLVSLSAVQSVLLEHAAAGVRPGGRLVYATCSSEPEENDDVVDRFLEQQRELFVEPGRERLQEVEGGPRLGDVCDARGRLRTLPHEHALEAFFGAVLVKANTV
jgi:16S rRNA (cytosine967-C5)-methyltransferase